VAAFGPADHQNADNSRTPHAQGAASPAHGRPPRSPLGVVQSGHHVHARQATPTSRRADTIPSVLVRERSRQDVYVRAEECCLQGQQARVRSGSAIARLQQEGAVLGGHAYVLQAFEAPQVTDCQRWTQAIPMLTGT
jgi:hypothetical protein